MTKVSTLLINLWMIDKYIGMQSCSLWSSIGKKEAQSKPLEGLEIINAFEEWNKERIAEGS